MGDQKQNNADFLDDFVVTVKKVKSAEDRPLLPELVRLPAKVKQVKKRQLPKSKSVRAHFTFEISSGKYQSQYAWGSVPLHEEVTEKADLYKWMCAILGVESLDVDNTVKIGDLIGKAVDIMVKNTKANGKTYQNVTEVLTPVAFVETKTTVVEEKSDEKNVEEPTNNDFDALDITEPSKEETISEDDLPF